MGQMQTDTSWFMMIMGYLIVVSILSAFCIDGEYHQAYATPNLNILGSSPISGNIDLNTTSENNTQLVIQQGSWDISGGRATVTGLTNPLLFIGSPVAEFYLKQSLSKDGKYTNVYSITNINATMYTIWIRTAPSSQDQIFLKVDAQGYNLFRGYTGGSGYTGDYISDSGAITPGNVTITTIYDITGGDNGLGRVQVYVNSAKIYDYSDVTPQQVSIGNNYYGGVLVGGIPDYIFGIIPRYKVPGFTVNSISVSSQNYVNDSGIWGALNFAGIMLSIVFWTPADIVSNGVTIVVFPWWLNAIAIKLPMAGLFYLIFRFVRGI